MGEAGRGTRRGSHVGGSLLGGAYSLGNRGLRAEAQSGSRGQEILASPNLAQSRRGNHSRAVFHLDGAHSAQAPALADVRAVTQQPAAAALKVLFVPERETSGHRVRRGGAAHASAGKKRRSKCLACREAPSRPWAAQPGCGVKDPGAGRGLLTASSSRFPPPRREPAGARSIHRASESGTGRKWRSCARAWACGALYQASPCPPPASPHPLSLGWGAESAGRLRSAPVFPGKPRPFL